eukprot:14685460-Ditylum_brightwellii.AAC.1
MLTPLRLSTSHDMPTPSLLSPGHKAPVPPDQLTTTTELFHPPSGYLTLFFTALALLSITSSDPILSP